MIQLERLGHLVLRVADLERSKRFYTELLGMHVLEQDPKHGGVFLGLGGGGNTLDLLQSSDPAKSGPYTAADFTTHVVGTGFHHAAFAVKTQEALRLGYFALLDNGVRIIAAVDHESQQSIYFNDPDGNVMEIYWERPNAIEIYRKGRGDQDTPLTFERPQTQ